MFSFGRAWWSGLLCFSLLAPVIVSAQTTPSDTGLHLVLSPVFLNIEGVPGRSVTETIKVKNAGQSVEELRVGLLRFRVYDDLGHPLLEEVPADDPFPGWLSFSRPTLTVQPGEWQSLDVTFNIPAEAALGYYYALTFARQNEAPLEEGANAQLVGAASILLLLNVETDATQRSAEVLSFTTDKKWYTYLPVEFILTIKNTGNTHLAPYGNVFVDRGRQTDIGILPVNQGKGNILPQSSRRFTATWSEGFPIYEPMRENGATKLDEAGETIYRLKWQWDKVSWFRVGKYTGRLMMVYDNLGKQVPLEASVSFWVIPWPILLAALLLLILILNGVWSTVRGIFRRRRK